MKKRNLKKKSVKLQIVSVNPVFSFREIPAGQFLMGSPSNEKHRRNDENQMFVEITKAFEIMKTEVTQRQWFQVMRNNPSYFKKRRDCKKHEIMEGIEMCSNHPVERVSWDEVQKFIKKLNDNLGLKGCKGSPHDPKGCYRLPTEAEWEWAVRAGTKTAYFFGKEASALGPYAWYWNNSRGRTHKVGVKSPNPWGLYDVYGNVWEWVQDVYKKKWPLEDKDSLVIKSSAQFSRLFHVFRGGSWGYSAGSLRSAKRFYSYSDYGGYDVGFRLVRTL